MTVIAWDGKTLAADRQSTFNDTRMPCTKLFRGERGEVIAITGNHPLSFARLLWFKNGAVAADFPKADGDDAARLIVLDADGLRHYENQYPYPLPVLAPFMAFGSGMDFALAAMAMGADAVRAVEVASQFDTGCGLGVDTMAYEPRAAAPLMPALPSVESYRPAAWSHGP